MARIDIEGDDSPETGGYIHHPAGCPCPPPWAMGGFVPDKCGIVLSPPLGFDPSLDRVEARLAALRFLADRIRPAHRRAAAVKAAIAALESDPRPPLDERGDDIDIGTIVYRPEPGPYDERDFIDVNGGAILVRPKRSA